MRQWRSARRLGSPSAASSPDQALARRRLAASRWMRKSPLRLKTLESTNEAVIQLTGSRPGDKTYRWFRHTKKPPPSWARQGLRELRRSLDGVLVVLAPGEHGLVVGGRPGMSLALLGGCPFKPGDLVREKTEEGDRECNQGDCCWEQRIHLNVLMNRDTKKPPPSWARQGFERSVEDVCQGHAYWQTDNHPWIAPGFDDPLAVSGQQGVSRKGGGSANEESVAKGIVHERTDGEVHQKTPTRQCRAGAECWARSFFDLSGDDLLVSENKARLD